MTDNSKALTELVINYYVNSPNDIPVVIDCDS